MQRMALPIAAALGVLAAVGFLVIDRPGPAPAAPEIAKKIEKPRPRSAEVDALRTEVRLVQAELAGLGDRVNEQAARRAVAAPEAPVTKEAAARPVSKGLDPELVQAHLDAEFESEVADASWSRGEERAITDFVTRQVAKGTRIDAVECRASMCRLKLTFENDTAREDFKTHIGEAPLDKGGFYRSDDATGFTFFAARAGHPLPRAPSLGT
jgi:hypothetical protein